MIRPVIRNVIRQTVKASGDVFGPEVSTDVGFDNSGDWVLSSATVNSSLLTLSPIENVSNASIDSALSSTLFDLGDLYSVEYVVVQAGTAALFLSSAGFSASISIPKSVGSHKVTVECTIEDGKIRLVMLDDSSDIIILESLSVRKVTQGRGVIR